jgi:hypothetical protein
MTANIVLVLVFEYPALGRVRTGFFQSVKVFSRLRVSAAPKGNRAGMLMAAGRRRVNVAPGGALIALTGLR